MLNSGLASPSFGSLSGERLPAMEERGFEEFLSVFICVHLWLHCMVTASRAGPASQPGGVNTAGVAGLAFARIQIPVQLRAGQPAPQKASA
jgi:hypothetical protein